MKELSLHILDIAENSVKAHATLIQIDVSENFSDNILTITVKDNGCGMDSKFLKTVTDPFSTTRKTRKVGLGIPLFKEAAIRCGGKFDIKSKPKIGTEVFASFELNHNDNAPLGNMADTVLSLVSGSPEIDFIYTHTKNDNSFIFSTTEIRNILGEVPLNSPEVLVWIKDYILNCESKL